MRVIRPVLAVVAIAAGGLVSLPTAHAETLPTACFNVFGDGIPQPPAPCPPGWTATNPNPVGVPMADRPGLIAAGIYCYHLPEGYFEHCAAITGTYGAVTDVVAPAAVATVAAEDGAHFTG